MVRDAARAPLCAIAATTAAIGLALLALASPAPAVAAPPLDVGFLDGNYTGAGPERETAFDRTVRAGAGIVRIQIGWVAPNDPERPAGFDARNPGDEAYDFRTADGAVRAAARRGLRVMASFTGAPRWAEGARRPPDAEPGSWRPEPRALEDYGVALARRYSGSFPDPQDPARTLPKVAAFQVWNEPNLDKYLTPQWSAGRPEAPSRYRRMLNAFTRGVRSTGSDALIVTAGTAPFGDPLPGGRRLMPARFVRGLLCLRDGAGGTRPSRCTDPPRFDVLAHHPYSVGSPRRSALNRDDVSIPDLGRLTRLVRLAERTGRAPGRRSHRIWVTEVSYDSSPPDPDGVPLATHARWAALTLSELRRQGVDTVFWYGVTDQRPLPSYGETSQSGVFFADGRPKPALRALRFPLVAERRAGGSLRVWGRAPAGGTLVIERRLSRGWVRVRTRRVSAGATFVAHFGGGGVRGVRARLGGETSLAYAVR